MPARDGVLGGLVPFRVAGPPPSRPCAVGADELRTIDRKAPRPVYEAPGDLVVQVGTNTP